MNTLIIDVESREAIRKIIDARNISVRALSAMVNISEQSVSSMLSGSRTLTDKTLAKMTKELGVPFELAKYGEGLNEYLSKVSNTTSVHQHGKKNINQAVIGNMNQGTTGGGGSIADELIKLLQLRDAGALTEEEFQIVKKKLLS